MAKQKSRIKLLQPIAIPWDLAIALVGAGVAKGPTVPKMEQMEKWLAAGGRDVETYRNKETGLVHATVIAPGAEGPSYHMGEGETMPLATAKAIHEYIKAQPKPDPAGADLPLFRGNGGVASVTEMGLDGEEAEAREEHAGHMDGLMARDEEIAAEAVRTREDDGWRHLNVIVHQDGKVWKQEIPIDLDHAPIVEWEEDREVGRGFWLAPGYAYDRELGEIRYRADGRDDLLWSRPAKPGAVEATRTNLVESGATL